MNTESIDTLSNEHNNKEIFYIYTRLKISTGHRTLSNEKFRMFDDGIHLSVIMSDKILIDMFRCQTV